MYISFISGQFTRQQRVGGFCDLCLRKVCAIFFDATFALCPIELRNVPELRNLVLQIAPIAPQLGARFGTRKVLLIAKNLSYPPLPPVQCQQNMLGLSNRKCTTCGIMSCRKFTSRSCHFFRALKRGLCVISKLCEVENKSILQIFGLRILDCRGLAEFK